jgi:hypothetical protein
MFAYIPSNTPEKYAACDSGKLMKQNSTARSRVGVRRGTVYHCSTRRSFERGDGKDKGFYSI